MTITATRPALPATRVADPVDYRRPGAPAPGTVVHVNNPWDLHVRGAFAAAFLTTVGGLAGAALDQTRLDVTAATILAAWAMVLLLVGAHTRHHNRPPA